MGDKSKEEIKAILDKYFKEWMKQARDFINRREKLLKEVMDFYFNILKTILSLGIDTVTFANYTFSEKKVGEYEIEEAIVIENGKPYYVDNRRELKIPLEDDRDLRDALNALFSEFIILRNHDKILEHLAREINKSLEGGGRSVLRTKQYSESEEEPV